MMGYQAHHELALLGKQFAREIYKVSDNSKIYAYYQSCSEGGREGWSQLQRFPDQFDGAVVGAPALRLGQQQVNHLFENVVEKTLSYSPPPCELDKIVNLTIAFCDPLDGLADGVVSRSDLCTEALHLENFIGKAYSCASSGSVPAQKGKITAKGVEVAQTMLNGLHNSQGQRAYITYRPGAGFGDVSAVYNQASGTWDNEISSLGGEWVARYLQLRDADNLDTLNGVNYDTLVDWMTLGMNRYYDSLQTTYPDLSALRSAGGKIIHIHGEQDNSVPTASSIHYYDSVRKIMYPNLSYQEGVAALDDFYRLYLIPGAAHCDFNPLQPTGPWPQTTLQTVIDWVERDVAPATLEGTGHIDTICKWPLRPMWSGNGKKFECQFSQSSIDSFTYEFDAFKVPVY
ncbi:uncharacterized protein PFLUO_LOCUS8273 [Penicillium psychrofluorescens]|uniref:uncharacterized protein n=1 Tax=Penicillium psychrofluorescens TaxID=3158075 RepID=UPI003CCD2352